jgi:hypothetical protein
VLCADGSPSGRIAVGAEHRRWSPLCEATAECAVRW